MGETTIRNPFLRNSCTAYALILVTAIMMMCSEGSLYAQDTAMTEGPAFWDASHPTMISLGVGTLIFPTPILATQSLGGGGGGIIGSNISVSAAIKENIAPHWRIPLSFSLAFLRGNEIFFHNDITSGGDTSTDLYSLANTVNIVSSQIGIEYFYPSAYITPFCGADIMYNWISATSLDFTIQRAGLTLENQSNSIPAMSRIGAVIRAGADLPIPDMDGMYFNVSAEVGAVNLINRANDWQLFTPTSQSQTVPALPASRPG